ncbi:MAG: hypothetical protein U0Q11_00160 [Vicinamibacterales bacterium]
MLTSRSVLVRADSFRQRQRTRFLLARVANGHRKIAPDRVVDGLFNLRNLLGRQLTIDVNRAGLTSEMKADGTSAGEVFDDRRQQMLTGVLLHVIESADPGDIAAYRRSESRRRTGDDVHDVALVVIEDVDDRRIAERAHVERLSAGGRIERRAIEPHRSASSVDSTRITLASNAHTLASS